MKYIMSLGSIIASLTSIGVAKAEPVLWKSLENWEVSFFDGIPGCAAHTVYDGGTWVFIGLPFSSGQTNLDIMFSNSNWTSLEVGKEYEVSIRFGQAKPWTLPMIASAFGEYKSLRYVISADENGAIEFISEFMRKPDMSIYYGNREVGYYSLKGSSEAIQVMVECQKSFNNANGAMGADAATGGKSQDPFGDGQSSDPFN